jgi:TetR/AcrR family transcriptional regulator
MESKPSTSSHERILQAAKHLFATRGYENTSTITIARDAGTSESQLVKHFGSKDGLLEAVFEQGWTDMADLFAAVEKCNAPAEKLRCLIDQTLAGLERDPELKELMLLEARRIRRKGNSVLLSRSFVEFQRHLKQLFAEMRACGQLRPGLPPEAACSALIGMCEGLLRDQLVAGHLGLDPGYTREDIREIINAVLPVFMAETQKSAART